MIPNPTKLEPPAVRASRLHLERSAIDETFCDYMTRSEPYGATEAEIEHSKAISLKRIADAAELIASCVMSGFGDPPEFNVSRDPL